MKGNAKVQVQNQKNGQVKYLLYIPARIVQMLKIQKGNIVEFDMDNPMPDHIVPPKAGLNFHKKKEPEPIVVSS